MTIPLIPTTIVENLEDVDFSGLKFPFFVLYDHPSDFPDKIVVRVFDMDMPTNCVAVFNTLQEARAAMPEQFIRLARDPADDPVIIESYV